MNNYLIIGIIISIVCLFIFNSDLLKLDFLNYEIRKKIKSKKKDMTDSSVNYDSDSNTSFNSNIIKNKQKNKNLDETEISFDDSSDKSKIFNNKNTNNKLLNNIKKMMINMKNKEKSSREKSSREKGRRDGKKENDINEMHKLAQQLSKKNMMQQKQQINQQSDTNYDLTDTISGIINNELNKNA